MNKSYLVLMLSAVHFSQRPFCEELDELCQTKTDITSVRNLIAPNVCKIQCFHKTFLQFCLQ